MSLDTVSANAASVYLGRDLATSFLAGHQPTAFFSNLPRAVVARYGAFYSTSSPVMQSFPVRFGVRYGFAPINLIAQITVGAVNWPYGNGLT